VNDEYRPPPRQENELKRKRDEAEQDPKLKEFLEVYQPPSKTKIWANGESHVDEANATAGDHAVPEVAVPDEESDDEYQVISKKPKVAAEPTATSAPAQPPPAEEPILEPVAAVVDTGEVMEDVQEAPAAEQGPVSDIDWLRSRTNRVLELVEDDEVPAASAPPSQAPAPAPQPLMDAEDSAEMVEAQPEPPQPTAEQPKDAAPDEEDKIRETGRLYLRNLHYEVTEDAIREQFSKHGALEEVSIHILSFSPPKPHAMMISEIGTTDASAFEVTSRKHFSRCTFFLIAGKLLCSYLRLCRRIFADHCRCMYR
jgi:multiple RNA-binding domain-containing protein 1